MIVMTNDKIQPHAGLRAGDAAFQFQISSKKTLRCMYQLCIAYEHSLFQSLV